MATIIKASAPLGAVPANSFHLDDLGDRAKEYLAQVRREATAIVAQAQQEADAIRSQAEEEGRAAAQAEAQAAIDSQLERQVKTLLPALHEAIAKITSAKGVWLAHWEKSAVHVAVAMAERVIRRQLAHGPEITFTLVREALELASGSGEIQLRMHPDDLAALGGQVERLAGEMSRLGKPEIISDPAIEKGGCRIDTRFGTIDQQFAAQLARLEQELT